MSENPETVRTRQKRWRDQRRASGLPARKPRPRRAMARPSRPSRPVRPFLGVVCIGAGKVRSNCMALRAGDFELHTGHALSTVECLEWILALPPAAEGTLVTYALAWLATHVLRDLPPDTLSNDRKRGIFDERKVSYTDYTYWRGIGRQHYGIVYLPGNYLRVCRVRKFPTVDTTDGHTWGRLGVVDGTARTISDVAGNFRGKPLLGALQDFDIASEHWATLAEARASRIGLSRVTHAARDVAALESGLLAELMTRFRDLCHGAGLRPRYWSGAGKLADFLHKENRTLTAAELAGLVPQDAIATSRRAFYAGRFETTRAGEVAGAIHEYDLNSAFPAAMLALPCLRHARWSPLGAADFASLPADASYMASVNFAHPPGQFLCGLPVRRRDTAGVLYPLDGSGTYWSHELRAAERAGTRIEYKAGWQITRHCRCQMFGWVADLYRQRLALGKDLAGETIKIAMACLYGKFAQRRGVARYENFIWAGHLTATVRATLNDVCRASPEAIVMLAADAVFTKTPLAVPCGDAMGEWSQTSHDGLFIVQSGLYWGATKRRSRGISVNLIEPHVPAFEAAWHRWIETIAIARATGQPHPEAPRVAVPLRLVVGLRLAHARGDLAQTGTYDDGENQQGRVHSFHWRHKRGRHEWEGHAVKTWPRSLNEASLSHGEAPELIAALDADKLLIEAQPDTIDMSIPFARG
jgi:hypothetical protein